MATVARIVNVPPRLRYIVPFIGVALCTLVRLALDPWLGQHAPFTIYVFGIMLSAVLGGLVPGLIATALSLLATHYFFLEPRHALLAIDVPAEPLSLLLYGLAGTFISIVCHALRASRDSFRAMAEGMPHMVWETDGHGENHYQNQVWYGYIGAGPGSSYGKDWLQYYHPDDRQRVMESWMEAVRSGGAHAYDVEARIRRHDGVYRWFRTTGAPIRNHAGVVTKWVGTCTDIHGLREVEQDLRRSRQMLQNVLDTVPVRVFWKDLHSVFLGCNRPFAQDAGRQSPDELVGKTDADMAWRDEADLYRADDRHVMESGQPKLGYEEPQTTPDGRHIWLRTSKTPLRDLDSRIVGVLGTYEDITEQKHAAQILARQAAELDTLYATAPVGLFFFDTDLRFVRVNHMLAELNGLPAEQHVGRHLRDVLAPNLAAETEPHLRQVVQTGQPVLDMEVHGATTPRPDEQRNWLVSYYPVRSDDGTIRGVHGVVQDITRRKAAEAALTGAKRAAEEASQAKDRFLAVLSHELRTPLTPVLAGVGVLQADQRFDFDTRDLLTMMRRNVELEAQLIDDLLDATRIASGKIELKRQRVLLGDVINHVVSTCRPDIDARGLSIAVDMGADRSYLLDADEMRLQQVFWNLLRNAIKFTPHGGCIGIGCRQDPAHPHQVVVEISDSGMGIEAETLGRIFNPFEQGERSVTRQFGGLGLGLAICKSLVEMHGGTIAAYSEGRGKGATFTLRLPIVAVAKGKAGQSVSYPCPAPLPPPQASFRILLVEDHGDTARLMKRLLESRGHTVRTASDVATAVDLIGSEPFDLLISDLGLPDGSGTDLMRIVRSRGNTLPGIALSGFGQDEDIHCTREAGFVTHLTKPVTLARLAEAINATVRRTT